MGGRLFTFAMAVLGGAACGDATSADCATAERQVEACLARLCDDEEPGLFCECHAAGQHLPAGRSCACAEGSVWDEMQESVCEELNGEPELDCEGLISTVRRFERLEGCE